MIATKMYTEAPQIARAVSSGKDANVVASNDSKRIIILNPSLRFHPSDERNFHARLHGNGAGPLAQSSATETSESRAFVGRSIESFQRVWQSAHLQTEFRIAKLSRENRELLGAQIGAQTLQRQAEFLGRAAEAIGETFRRLQQMGAN